MDFRAVYFGFHINKLFVNEAELKPPKVILTQLLMSLGRREKRQQTPEQYPSATVRMTSSTKWTTRAQSSTTYAALITPFELEYLALCL